MSLSKFLGEITGVALFGRFGGEESILIFDVGWVSGNPSVALSYQGFVD